MVKYLKQVLLIIILFFCGLNVVDADGNYTISLSSTSVTKGKSVTLYIKGNNLNGGFIISSSNSSVASLSDTQVWLDNNTRTVTISSLNVGSSVITVTPTKVSTADCVEGDCDLNLGAKTLTLNVISGSNSSNANSNNNVTEKKSNDATLKALSIEGIDISPEFKSDVFEYKASVEAGVEKVKINATPNDSNASVTGSGEIEVSEGVNKLEVVVTASDGSTKTYVITVDVKDYNPINVKIGKKNYTVVRKEADLPEADLFEKCKVEIGDEEVVGYYNDKLNIYLIGLKDDKGNISLYVYDSKKRSYVEYKWITVGGVTLYLKDVDHKLDNFKKYSTTIKNTKLNIYKLNKNDKIGLIYGTNVVTGNTSWYVYDKEEATLARYFNLEVDIYKNTINSYKNYLMIFMGVFSSVIIVIVIFSLIKGKKRRRKVKNS